MEHAKREKFWLHSSKALKFGNQAASHYTMLSLLHYREHIDRFRWLFRLRRCHLLRYFSKDDGICFTSNLGRI